MGFATGRDPLDDPLVTGWDAVVRNAPAPADADPADTALLRRFHALETIPPPSSTFFDDLERHLASLSPSVAPTVAAGPVPAEGPPRPSVIPSAAEGPPRRGGFSRVTLHRLRPNSSAHRTTQTRPGWIPQNGRWVSMQGALAVLAVMLIASLFVLYQAVPGPSEPPAIPAAVVPKPAIEPITQFEFVPPMWGMPDATAWNQIKIGMFSVAPATSFSTDLPFYTSFDGPLSLTVLRGELTVTPAGPAFFYPAHQSGQPPVEVSAGETVAVGPDDAIVYSSADAATGSNPGTVSTLTLFGSVGSFIDTTIPPIVPNDVSFITFEYTDSIPSVPTKGAIVTLQRLDLAPFDTFVFEPDADLRYLPFFDPAQTGELRMDEGAIEGLVPEPGAQRIRDPVQLRYLTPGPHTIFNLGDKTASIYFLEVEAVPDPATPAA